MCVGIEYSMLKLAAWAMHSVMLATKNFSLYPMNIKLPGSVAYYYTTAAYAVPMHASVIMQV